MKKLLKTKRGVSPLIATIILIAFAVALGAVVMNIGRTIGQPSDPQTTSGCSVPINLEIVKINENQKICLNDAENQVEMTLKNGGKVIIDNLHVTVIGQDLIFNKGSILTQKLGKADARKFNVEYDKSKYGEIEQVIITPEIIIDGETIICEESRVQVEAVPPC